jgi:DNA-binding NarL/FixJ family response regulator
MSQSGPGIDGPLRVLVVDADDRTRESLIGLLSISGQCMVVASAGQVGQAIDLALAHRPDVVVVDPRLPELDGGIVLITRLRAELPSIRILAMSWSDSLESAALQSGADGFVRKTFRPTELTAAIVAAGRGVKPAA